jgi:hypothetical protein
MDPKRGVSALGRKVRMMRHQQSSAFRNAHIVTSPSDPEPDPAPSEEAIHLETQKKILMNKLTQLSQEYSVEEQKRKSLEEQVLRARGRPTGTFHRIFECEALRDRLKIMHDKLSDVQAKFQEHLDVLAELRSQIDVLRQQRIDRRKHGSKSPPPPTPASPPAIEPPKQLIRLTDGERVALLTYQREAEKFTRLCALRRNSASLSSEPAPGEILTETELHQLAIRKILDSLQLNSLVDLFAEAEKIERENRETYMFIAENDELKRHLIDEIAELEQQFDEVSTGRKEREEEQMLRLTKLNLDIIAMQTEIADIQKQKNRDGIEFSVVYSAIEELFNALQCAWDDSPDGSMTVTATNALFALGAIEIALADMTAAMAKAGKEAI